MSRQRRSRNASESTSETRKDRSSAGSTSDSAKTESRTPTPSAREETDPVTDETAGRSAGEDKKEVAAESSTRAAAIVKQPVRKRAVCPKCHERRYKPEQVSTKVKCINCRNVVVLI